MKERLIFILVLSLLTPACSTSTKESKQKVLIETTINEKPLLLVRCHIKSNDIDRWISTPESIEVSREPQHLLILCQKSGYQMLSHQDVSATKDIGTSAAGGAGIGAGTGAIYGLPVLILPVVGEIIYASVIASTAAVGAGVSVVTDKISGKGYSLPSRIKVPMKEK